MSFIGAIGRGFTGAIGGFLEGGPVGAIRGGVRGVLGGGAARPSVAPRVQLPATLPGLPTSGGFRQPLVAGGGREGPNVPAGFPGAVPEPGLRGAVQRFLPGGQSGFTGAPPGFHVNKAYLRHLQAAAQGRNTQNPFNEQRAVNVLVRNRSMNPLNPRALRRANARQIAAVRLMRSTLKGTGYTISRGRFKVRGRKR